MCVCVAPFALQNTDATEDTYGKCNTNDNRNHT